MIIYGWYKVEIRKEKHLSAEDIGKYSAISQEVLNENHALLSLPPGSEQLKDGLEILPNRQYKIVVDGSSRWIMIHNRQFLR